MVKFINPMTGTEMMVAESRVEEYKAAGYKLAADLEKPEPEPVEKPKAVKKTSKKK